MKRIMIMGCSGSGKSTLAHQLHQMLGIEQISLDFYYMKPNWVETPKAEWEPIVEQLSDKESWVMDGNYGSSMDIRLKKADTIVYLDYPTWRCMYRVIKRTIKHYNQVRPGMAAGCKERFSLEFLHYVLTFRMIRRKSILKKLQKAKQSKNVYVLTSDRQVSLFLESLP